MPEINYQSVKQHINERLHSSFDAVYLIFGEEYVYRKVAQALVNAIIPDPAGQKHNYEVVAHRDDGLVADVIEKLNTYSFFSEKKILELRDASIFVSARNSGNLLQKAKQLYENNDFEKAADRFLSLLSRLQLDLSDISPPAADDVLAERLNLPDEYLNETEWIKKICHYCRERNLSVPEAGDDAERLRVAVESGFPKNNRLIITTETVDKRKSLYKIIKKVGTVIDCSIAKGNRKADVEEQRHFLQQHARQLMQKYRKQIDSGAVELIFTLTGFDVRAFTTGLEKLVDYVKDRDHITSEDVKSVLIRTRKDPVYELTGALALRDTIKTLYYMRSLLTDGFHYLQILAALTNQIRKLLVIKDFLESGAGRTWHHGIGYDQFRQNIIPLIVQYDEALIEKARHHQAAGRGDFDRSSDLPKKGKFSSDLVIAKNPNNPYPVFQQFLNSRKYTTSELLNAMHTLRRADVTLKTSGRNPATILEETIFTICGLPQNKKQRD